MRRHRSSRAILPLLLLSGLLCSALIPGCSSSTSSARQRKPIREYEQGFDPGRYSGRDRQPASTSRSSIPADSAARVAPATAVEPDDSWVERTERMLGFRVQLFSCSDLREAEDRLAYFKAQLDSLAPDITFDPPVYKIRVGNCVSQQEAQALRDSVKAAGVPEAWIVRAPIMRVIRERK